MNSRDRLISSKRRIKSVWCDEVGELLYFRHLSAGDFLCGSSFDQIAAFISCLTDDKGNKVFTIDDYDDVADLPIGVITKVVSHAQGGNEIISARSLIQSPDRKFQLQLAIKTGWSLEYIEALPFEVLAEFKALNAWHPFTEDRQAHQLGVIASMLSAKVYKKPMKPDEIFPYLQSGVPDFLEDERVAKARKIFNSLGDAPSHIRDSQISELRAKIGEEIEIEKDKDFPDMYVITQLEKIVNGN